MTIYVCTKQKNWFKGEKEMLHRRNLSVSVEMHQTCESLLALNLCKEELKKITIWNHNKSFKLCKVRLSCS